MSRPGYPDALYGHDQCVQYYTDGLGNEAPPFFYDGNAYLSHYVDKVGENTPGWPAVKGNNSYARVDARRRDTPCYYLATGDGTSVKYEGYVSFMEQSGNWDPGDESTLDGQAMATVRSKVIQKLQDKIADQKINVGQFWAERTQTINLVTSTARRLAGAITSLKHGNVRGAGSSLFGSGGGRKKGGTNSHGGRDPKRDSRIRDNVGGLPEQWLALQYGWKPLLGDIDGACKELAELATQSPPVLSAGASFKSQGPLPSWANDYVEWKRINASISGKGYLEMTLASTFGQKLARTGILNPYALAWELLPYSFVVDWFVPVGDFLSRLNWDTGLAFSRGWYTQKRSISWVGKGKTTTVNAGGYTTKRSGGTSSTNVTVFNREPFGVSPPVEIPHFKDPLSLTHMANALSLLAVAFDAPDVDFSRLG